MASFRLFSPLAVPERLQPAKATRQGGSKIAWVAGMGAFWHMPVFDQVSWLQAGGWRSDA
jgi:hypothetical protein